MIDPTLTDYDGTPLYRCIIGRAGTGKSFMAKQWADEDSSCVLTATTGIAATNLGAGTTINSLLWYEKTDDLEESYRKGKLLYRLTDLMKSGVRRIIIDEVSMLSGQQLDLICHGLDEANNAYFHSSESTLDVDSKLGLTLLGDALQLPPIDRDRKPTFFFEAAAWDRFAPNITHLTEIYRQADQDFIEALRLVRCGNGKAALEYFRPMIHPTLDNHYEGTTAMPHNLDVDRMNKIYLNSIDSPYIVFKSHLWGERTKEWSNIPNKLYLKLGALVMILSNKKRDNISLGEAQEWGESPFAYVNGDLGILTDADVESNTAYVKLYRTGEVVPVFVHRREYTTPMKNPGTGKIKRTLKGILNYVPIRVAHASTFHKLQGLTLDRVQVEFRKPFCGMPGMMYVALSRARSAEGLRLVGSSKLFVQRCTVDPKLREWM